MTLTMVKLFNKPQLLVCQIKHILATWLVTSSVILRGKDVAAGWVTFIRRDPSVPWKGMDPGCHRNIYDNRLKDLHKVSYIMSNWVAEVGRVSFCVIGTTIQLYLVGLGTETNM